MHCSSDAARAAGAEVREGCSVVELGRERDRIRGVRLQESGAPASPRSRRALIVGADGKHSTIVRLGRRSRAPYRRPSHIRLLHLLGRFARHRVARSIRRNGFAASAWPTNDGLTMTYVAGRLSRLRSGPTGPDGSSRRDPRRGRQPR